jgi:hypothetical protein
MTVPKTVLFLCIENRKSLGESAMDVVPAKLFELCPYDKHLAKYV